MRARRVLLTGGAGFIGLRMAGRLLAEGSEVTVMDDLSRGRLDDASQRVFSMPGARFVEADLRDPGAFASLDPGFDTMIHLAAVIGIQTAAREPVRVLETNAATTMNVVDFWRRTGARMVFASTSEVYGALLGAADIPVPSPESVPVGVRDTGIARYSYAVSKIFGEALVRQVTGSTGLPSLIVRPHNVYGPRMGFDHVIPQMSLRAIRRETPFRVFGAAETRAFCHVDDFCRAVTMLMDCGAGGVFHVGTDRETVIGDLARAVMDLAGLEAPVEELPSQEGSPPRRCPDISKLREATGYSPSVTLEEGLEETFLWYRACAAENPGLLELAATP